MPTSCWPPACRLTGTRGPLVDWALLLVLAWGVLSIMGPATVQAQNRTATDTTRADSLRTGAPVQRPADANAPSVNQLAADDSLAVTDSVRADTAVVDTALINRYVPQRRSSRGLFDRPSPFVSPMGASGQGPSVTLDSSGTHYRVEDTRRTDGPMRLSTAAYQRQRRQDALRENWTSLLEQRQQQVERGGLGVNMVVPGGRQSAFSTIFGKPKVDLRVNGQANIQAGFQYSKNDQQGARTGDATQIDPNFKQTLNLGITGTIGDKMQINVDWDTNNQFDYQNQVKLEYTGYEDEIVQSVEAGNVFLETPSQLISGGQSLFGIKSRFQLGNLSLTTIASQQEGQSNSLSIEGGSETTEFDLKPTNYDEDTHYFLGYYFRNTWNEAHQDPTTLTLLNGFDQITDIEVWKLRTSSGPNDSDVRKAAAVVDLGESEALVREADGYTLEQLPRPQQDQYTDADLEALRDGETTVSTYVSSSLNQPLGSQDVVTGDFKRLQQGRDYRLKSRLGFLSLTQRLRPSEALAVAFRYRAGGQIFTVGDFAGDQGGTDGGINADRLVLKLLRPTDPVAPGPAADADTMTSEPAAWFLEMRNIYQLGGRGFDGSSFELDIEYEPSGEGATTTIPEVSGQAPLLQALGLDRVDENGAPTPDNQFDFTRFTIDSEQGLLYFPYVQPFGERILEAAEDESSGAQGQEFAFQNLYLKKKTNAEKEDKQKNAYRITGSYKGQTQGFYDLKAFAGLVEGSVEVTSGGQTLQEGTDYVVDYQSGTVNVTNQSYLAEGREINISYEQNSIADLQQKTLLGARADWSLRDQYSLGATVMRLSQKSPVDKYRVGEEPIKNTIWGVNGSMDLTPRWLTQAVDALPLVQTRAESQISITGEFAQLRPGHTRTEAYERTIQEVSSSDRDSFAPDERNGISYVDDFEGFENTFSLREQLNAWQVSAAPDSIGTEGQLDGDTPGNEDDQARTHWRGSFGWYQLNEQIKEQLDGKVAQRGPDEATRLLDVQEVFDRDTRGSANPTLRTLDFYFNPYARGPYNFTPNLEEFIRRPTQVWGGITRRMPEGYTDFSVQNVEFVEFIVKVYPENGEVSDDATLYLDLGTISEDVIPNERINTEDGLSTTFNPSELGTLSRIAGSPSQNGAIDIRDGKTEDLGIDGLVSYTSESYNDELLETNFYSDFVTQADSLRGALGQLGLSEAERRRLRAEVARIQDDPAGDDYQYYENDRYFDEEAYFPRGATLQQRFSQYYAGYELNGFESQNRLAENVSLRRGVARAPNTEDLDGTGGNVTLTNSYYQYAIPLDELRERAGRDTGPKDYVVSRVGEQQDWYKVRIPVQEPTRTVGNIENFTRIQSIRMWTTGHAAPVTMRFASFELVGSQWRASQPVREQPVEEGDEITAGDGEVRVASVNNEEDPQYQAPVGAIVSRSQTSRGAQRRNREQALLLNVDELAPGQQRGIFKSFSQGLDLLKYSNLRMYTHVHGASNSAQVKDEIRDNLRLFVRIGANETEDYYEYEQRLLPNDVPTASGSQRLWKEENEMNLLLSALSQLKTARDQSPQPADSVYTSTDAGLPLDFAPDSTVIKIRGTPSLSQVNTAVIGVRHVGENSASALENISLWVNELRVSGYDERSGWAANSTANIDLADLATLQGSFQRRTDGFGGLTSTLNERQSSDNTSWSVRADLKLGSLFPDQQGWRIPVTLQMQSSLTEPRYDPERGDIEINEVQQLYDNLEASELNAQFGDRFPSSWSDSQIREALKDSVRRSSQSYNLRRTVTANFSKQDSDAWLMRQTVDATSLNFSYFDRTARSPQRSINNQWNWNGAFEYRLNFGRARTITPLWFLPDLPVLRSLGDIAFNYAPSSLSFSGSAERDATTRRSRLAARRDLSQPPRIANPFRENQEFTHRRSFNLQYNPFQFLSFNFGTNTRQSLSDVGSRTQTNIILSDSSVVGRRVLTNVDTSAFFGNEQSFIPDLPDTYSARDSLGRTLFVEDRQQLRSEWDVFQDLVFGNASPRTNQYGQRLSTTLRIGLLDREAFNWIDLQDINYESSFGWQNSAPSSDAGASVRNEGTLRTGVSLRPNRVWERFGFFERMKEAQREEGRSSGGSGEEDEDGGGVGWDDVPLPNPVGVLRGLALTVLDIGDITVNYTGNRTSQSSNVGDATYDNGDVETIDKKYRLLDAVRGEGPSLGYRLGLERSIPTRRRVFPEGQRVIDNLTNSHEFDGSTTLSPSRALEVDLNWSLSWSNSPQVSFRQTEGGDVARSRSERGQTSASVWAFGSYGTFFEEQLNTLQASQETADTLAAADVPLTNASVTSDFQSAYLTAGGTGLANGFAPFPMPGWTVRYTGLSDWPLIRSITDGISIRHGYSASYQTGFTRSNIAGEGTSLSIGGQDGTDTFAYRRAPYELGSPRIQQEYNPLIGVDITWPGDLQTSVEWGQRTTTALRTASLRIAEKETSEISGNLSFSATGFTIPFLPFGRIENRVRFSVTFTRQVNDEREYSLRPALEQANGAGAEYSPQQAQQGDNVSIISQTERLTLTPQITYSISDRVTADFTLEYEKFNGDSRQPSYTNVNGSFNVQVNISQ